MLFTSTSQHSNPTVTLVATPHMYRIQLRQALTDVCSLLVDQGGTLRADFSYRHCRARILYSLPLAVTALFAHHCGWTQCIDRSTILLSLTCSSAVLVHEFGMEGLEVGDDMLDLLLLRRAHASQSCPGMSCAASQEGCPFEKRVHVFQPLVKGRLLSGVRV